MPGIIYLNFHFIWRRFLRRLHIFVSRLSCQIFIYSAVVMSSQEVVSPVKMLLT